MSFDPVSFGIMLGLTALQMAMTASQKFEGQRLDSLDVSIADYGTQIPRFWGIYRHEGAPIIWAEKLREKKKTNKTKGGKFAEYKYFGTWAVLIADHEIDAVSRIWLDKHLVYQTVAAGPVSPVLGLFSGPFGTSIKLGQGRNMRIYLGTEVQEPDPRMEAWCEDRYGANSCPGYKGVSYIVFQDIPLEKFGNRIPQITVEAVHTKADAFPYGQVTTGVGSPGAFAVSPSGEWMIRHENGFGAIEWWDLPSRTNLGYPSGPALTTGTASNFALAKDGTAYFVGQRVVGASVQSGLYVTPPLGQTTIIDTNAFWFSGPTRVFDTAAGRTILTGAPGAGYHLAGVHIDTAQSGRDFCVDGGGDIWTLFQPVGASDQFTMTKLGLGGESHNFTGTARSGYSTARVCHVQQYSHFFVVTDGYFYIIDDQTFTVTASASAPWGTAELPQNNPTAASFWAGYSEYSLKDGSLIRALNSYNWLVEGSPVTQYDPVNHAIMTAASTAPHVTWRYLDRVTSNGVTLGTIVADVGGWCGVTALDTSALDQVVTGYCVVQGAGRDMVEPLLTAHDSDARPHDFAVQFIKRGSAPAGTLLTRDFWKDGEEPRFAVTIAQDTDLARRITVNFADAGKDHQNNNVVAQRSLDAVDSVRDQSIDMSTYVSTPAEMQKLADRYLRRLWNDREEIRNGLTPMELKLEPGDTRTLSFDDRVERIARCTKLVLTNGGLKVEWKRDHPSLAALSTGTGAAMEGRDPDAVYVPGPTKVMVLDIPLVADVHENAAPQVYYGAGRYIASAAWPGATLYIADNDGDEFAAWNGVDSSDGMIWGRATNVLANADPWLWDRGNSVNINSFGGVLATVTEANILADPGLNLACLGGELLNFTTAVLEANGTYTLSGFLRGRRGTEWATAGHAAGDEFVLVAGLKRDGIGLSEVGTSEAFKGTTIGRNVDNAEPIAMTFSGATLKPYAPARVKAVFDGADWTFTVIRRTRVGGAWVGGTTIPLSEASEAYEIEVYSGSTLKRTLALTGTNIVTYTNAMQVADFGATQTAKPPLAAYQLSDAVGRGFALAA